VTAEELIERLGLEPHPEGGHYAQTWRGTPRDGRDHASAIHFLLRAGERSHWHRVDADEIWSWHAGDPLQLSVADDDEVGALTLGVDVAAGEHPHAVVPAHAWQAAESLGEWTLVSCFVVPGFEFDGFELAPPGWSPGSPVA
jgi:predicted cupin superfamily sugar epimerase